MKETVIRYIKEYIELTRQYLELDSDFIISSFEDKIYYDALGYQGFIYKVEDNQITNKELLESQFDLATKVNDLKTILKNIKANEKLMKRINPIYA